MFFNGEKSKSQGREALVLEAFSDMKSLKWNQGVMPMRRGEVQTRNIHRSLGFVSCSQIWWMIKMATSSLQINEEWGLWKFVANGLNHRKRSNRGPNKHAWQRLPLSVWNILRIKYVKYFRLLKANQTKSTFTIFLSFQSIFFLFNSTVKHFSYFCQCWGKYRW